MQHVRYTVTHDEGHCPANDAGLLKDLLARLPELGSFIEQESGGKIALVQQEFDRNGHRFEFCLRLDGLRVEEGGDLLKAGLGLKKITIRSRTYETVEQAAAALEKKLAALEA